MFVNFTQWDKKVLKQNFKNAEKATITLGLIKNLELKALGTERLSEEGKLRGNRYDEAFYRAESQIYKRRLKIIKEAENAIRL